MKPSATRVGQEHFVRGDGSSYIAACRGRRITATDHCCSEIVDGRRH